jgi:hypothetical protein
MLFAKVAATGDTNSESGHLSTSNDRCYGNDNPKICQIKAGNVGLLLDK